jgi:hypothetical protein
VITRTITSLLYDDSASSVNLLLYASDNVPCPGLEFLLTGFSQSGAPICEHIDDTPNDDCEDAQALLPSQLNTAINAAQNLVQPIIDPAQMPQELGDWQKLLKKLEDYQAKMAAEQAKPQPNQNKLNNWQAQANHTVAQIDQVVPSFAQRTQYCGPRPQF